MTNIIELQKWYLQKNTENEEALDAAFKIVPEPKGTHILVRGKADTMLYLTHRLLEDYFNDPQHIHRAKYDCNAVFNKVLQINNVEDNPIYFGNDRINYINKMSCKVYENDTGPFINEEGFVEFKIREQHGGTYPREDNHLNSRANLIEKVLSGFGKLGYKIQEWKEYSSSSSEVIKSEITNLASYKSPHSIKEGILKKIFRKYL